MLLYWKQHYGSSAEFKPLAAGLEHPLVQRRDVAYKYCYITTGFGQTGRELRTIPPEIKARGLEAELAYENALRIGMVKVYRARIILIGQDRARKTSLKKSLLGLRFDPEEQSTSGIEVDPSSFEVNVDQVKNWQRTAKQEGVSQFVEELAKMVAGKLESEEARI